jgi:hypothetical protein
MFLIYNPLWHLVPSPPWGKQKGGRANETYLAKEEPLSVKMNKTGLQPLFSHQLKRRNKKSPIYFQNSFKEGL